MYLYFVTQKDFNNDFIILNPRIPKTIGDDEEAITPRICMSTSILGAMSSICKNLNYGCKTFIYKLEISNDEMNDDTYIHYPTENEVPDAFYTGEVWVLKSVQLKLFKTLKITNINIHDVNENISIGNFIFKEL